MTSTASYNRDRLRGLIPIALFLEGTIPSETECEIRAKRYDPRSADSLLIEAMDVRQALRKVRAREEIRASYVWAMLHSKRKLSAVRGMSLEMEKYEADLLRFLNLGGTYID